MFCSRASWVLTGGTSIPIILGVVGSIYFHIRRRLEGLSSDRKTHSKGLEHEYLKYLCQKHKPKSHSTGYLHLSLNLLSSSRPQIHQRLRILKRAVVPNNLRRISPRARRACRRRRDRSRARGPRIRRSLRRRLERLVALVRRRMVTTPASAWSTPAASAMVGVLAPGVLQSGWGSRRGFGEDLGVGSRKDFALETLGVGRLWGWRGSVV